MPALGEIEGLPNCKIQDGIWTFDEDDFLLMAMLQDPVYAAELLWDDPSNREYGGCYRVRDYQYPLFRTFDNYAGFACARSVGKTESIKAKSFTHPFRRQRQNLLVTAPELIHLLPLTDAIEERIRDCRLTREFLDTRAGKTGFTHRPFGVEFLDGTKIVGRIPRLTGPQPLHENLLTPDGWIKMRSVMPGDRVIGSDGLPTEVLGVTNAWESETFEVEFTDGTVVETDGGHLWTVSTASSPMQRTRSTVEIGADLAGDPKATGGRLSMWKIPPTPVVLYAEPAAPPPLDPYIVGALLGDGAISGKSAVLIAHDPEVVEEVERRLPDTCSMQPIAGKKANFRLVGPDQHKPNPVLVALRELGLLGHGAHHKFIPDRLRFGRPEERLDLIRGLMDTDGTARESGAAGFLSASRTLAEHTTEVVRSLGGWASAVAAQHASPGTITADGKEYVQPGGVYWRSTLRLKGANLFLLPRKAARYRSAQKQRHKSIRVVRPTGRVERVRCIKVAADDGLYLTSGGNLTHNTGVKGQHQPDLLIDEAQDFPERGWTEVHETVMKDDPTFTYHFYGVHSGARDSGFYKRINQGGFVVVQITAIQRPGWNKAEKDAAKAAYGGTGSPDYRRNIYGEAGDAASAFFVTARLVACLDQERESDYNELGYVKQELRAEEVDEIRLPIAEILDLPGNYGGVYLGADIGLTNSPTVVSIFSHESSVSVYKGDPKRERLRLIRMYKLHRFRPRQIRETLYSLGWHFAHKLKAGGIDATGLGFPIFQDMEDDEATPPHLLDVTRGYFFNSKVPVNVRPEHVTEDARGNMRDQYGAAVKEEEDEFGAKRLVTYMPMIEASTRYLREMVDSQFLLLPFDTEITTDMQGETQQRVLRVGQMSGLRKPNAFHILDSFRGAAMGFKADEIEAALEVKPRTAVLDSAL